MPSEAAKKRKEKKKAQNLSRGKPAGAKTATTNGETNGVTENGTAAKNGSLQNNFASMKLSNLSVSGVLMSHPEARDVHLGTISLRYHGAELLTDANIELNSGRRYGLLGPNGCGMHHLSYFKIHTDKGIFYQSWLLSITDPAFNRSYKLI